jgi:cytochrome c oxidase subunit I+III
MPRRVYTYLPGLGWEGLNLISTAGAFLMGAGTAVFVWNLIRSWRKGPEGGADPWEGHTLEWATDSPPRNYNFHELPGVRGRDPLRGKLEPAVGPFWLRELVETPEPVRETLVSSVLTAEPEGRVLLPGPSAWPFWTALGLSVAFLGAIWTTWLVPVGLLLTFIALVGWHWPDGEEGSLSRQLTGLQSPIIWGVLMLVAIEATLLALFGVSWFYVRLGADAWPPGDAARTDLLLPTVGQVLLLLSPVPVWLGLRALVRGRPRLMAGGLSIGLLLAGSYLALKAWEYATREMLWTAHAYASFDWTMSGYAGLHVMTLLLGGAVVLTLTHRGHFGPRRYTGIQALVLYWAFVALGSLFFYAIQYLAPRI